MSASPKPDALSTADFDYALPRELIASHPAACRDASRLLVLHRDTGDVEHRTFSDVLDLIPPGDVLVLNETRVFPARLLGRKPTGANAEVLLLHPLVVERPESGAGEDRWIAVVRPGGKLRAGTTVVISDVLSVGIEETLDDGRRIVRLDSPLPPREAIALEGAVPLPPYIERPPTAEDRDRYQTVYATDEGSVAAPTAGLHFTDTLLDGLVARGVHIARLVLHVGIGTFRPVEVEDPADHPMHAERYTVPEATMRVIDGVRIGGGHVWAVGTTVARTLESCVDERGRVLAGEGWTSLFIRPGFRFRAVDRLITNFHLPRSTLLMLVSAFGGHAAVMGAYAEAVARGYRFYSYGDAMVLI